MKAANEDGMVRCVTCNCLRHYKEMDGGHYISRAYSFHTLREENVHPQCKGCNRFFTKVFDDYRRYMVEMYGEEFTEWLTDTKHRMKKFTRIELLDIVADLQERIKDQEVRLGER